MTKKITQTNRDKFFWLAFILGSIGLVLGSYLEVIPFSLTEDFGFISGALTVWWAVKENVWSWPVGIINAIFFIILFLQVRLYADMALQVVYIVLGFLGWYWWLKGGKNQTELKVSRVSRKEVIVLTLVGIVSTYFMTKYLISINDSAPFLDALTTVMSLVAQYMLTKKLVENWYVWISADIIYIGLYIYKELYLTSVLYLVFLLMCIHGLKLWKLSYKKNHKS